MADNPERRAQADRAQRQERATNEALQAEAKREAGGSQASAPERRQPPPAGWYPHPTMADTRRYWDGARWTDHIAPVEPLHLHSGDYPSGGRPKVDPSFAWAFALLPVVAIPAYYLFPTEGGLGIAVVGIWFISLILATMDAKRLQQAGIKVNSSWAVLLGLAYLMARTKAAKSTPALPLVWCGAVAVYFAVISTLGYVAQHDRAEVEGEIESWLDTQGVSGATVDCPEISGRDGAEFDCTAVTDEGTLPVTVTLTNDGSYKWQIN